MSETKEIILDESIVSLLKQIDSESQQAAINATLPYVHQMDGVCKTVLLSKGNPAGQWRLDLANQKLFRADVAPEQADFTKKNPTKKRR